MSVRQFFYAVILVFFSVHLAYPVTNDSIKLQQENGTLVVLHQVEAKETLFSLSQRYGSSVESIIAFNQINNNSLSVGAIIKIPWNRGVTHLVEPGQTLYSLSKLYQVPVDAIKQLNGITGNDLEAGSELLIIRPEPDQTKINQAAKSADYHVVTAEETLYSLSKQYNLDLDKLKDWNGLTDNSVQIGDTLRLKEPISRQIIPANNPPPRVSNYPKSGEAKPVQEQGIAAVINGSTDTKKYLALHPTAPFGTIMKVRNELTNLSVFVRVVGPLPATGANNNILIRLSPAAQEALGSLDNKFRVELSYVSQ